MLGFSILASAALKGTIVLGAASSIAWILRRRSAAARHLVWTATAAALLALPILSVTLPALRVPAKPTGVIAAFQVFSSGRTGSSASAIRSAAPVSVAARAGVKGREIDFRAWTVLIWAVGAAAFLLQMLFACFALRRLRRDARPLGCDGLREELGIRHPVDVLEAACSGMPMTYGVIRPTVLLPQGAAEWRPDRLRVVLLHELAHVRRGDVATHLLARTALALYWWNPLAWLAWREFLKERERATDDLVLHAGERASDYAGHLLEVARTLQPAPATAWAAIAMARRSQLEGRLVAILDSGVARKPSGRRAPLAAALIAAALIAPFAAMQAQDPAMPAEADATIRAANAQKNHEILDRAAAAYERLSKYDVAQKLLESSLTIREEVSGSGSAAYAAGLVKLGDLAAKRRQTDEAVAFYSKAVSLGDRPEVAPALLYLGMRALDRSDRPAAQSLFERVLNVESKGSNAGRALTFLAVLRQVSKGGEPEAELLYQRALAAMPAKSPDSINTLSNYSRLLRRLNRAAEADELDAQVSSIKGNVTAAVSSQGVMRVGGGVSAPSLLYKSEPEYTEVARDAKYQGTVLLYIEVGPDGLAHNIKVARSLGLGLDEKAIEAVQRWKFKPGMKDGQPVTVAATIEINFRLN
jgi:TonB family protein